MYINFNRFDFGGKKEFYDMTDEEDYPNLLELYGGNDE